ncbi:MAG: hypothetical protein KJ069_04780 [Anaerolineae bacterium]|nr:hypothetical protein [Anaerolineae bacterium]
MKSLKKKFIFVLGCILILGAVLAACGNQEAAEASPTATNTATLPPSPADTAVPTLTLTATQTATPEPTATLQPTDTPTTTPTPEATATADDSTTTPSDFPLPIPTGNPAAEWNGMPIMPQAIAGEGNDESYAFIVEASPNEIQTFYEQELSKLGWSLLGVGEGETGAILMVFQNGAEVASISILTVDSSTQYVFLVK